MFKPLHKRPSSHRPEVTLDNRLLTEIFGNEISLCLGCESHTLKGEKWNTPIGWLVLSGHSPHGYARCFIGIQESTKFIQVAVILKHCPATWAIKQADSVLWGFKTFVQ